MTPAIDITDEQRRTVLALLNRHLPDTTAWACGSRVKWTSRPESDLDLVVFARPEQSAQVAELREAFEESNLPFRVDLFVWDEVPGSFRVRVKAECAELTSGSARERIAADRPYHDNDWTAFRLGDVCKKIGSGMTPRGGSKVYLDTGSCALIRSQNIHNDGFHRSGLVFIDEKQATTLANVEVQPHDVLLNITGDSVARCCQVNFEILPARVNQHVAIIRPDFEVLDPQFLRYTLVESKMQNRMLSWAGSGATRNALTKGMIESFEVLAPTKVQKQHAIAHILGTLDDKIELNRRMNETLEAMMRALFKSWFVDFDPVRAKMEGHDTGLPQPIADLFPDRLADSECGKIPQGWKAGRLADIAIAPRRNADPANLDDKMPYIGLEHMPRRSIALTAWERIGKVTSNKSIFKKSEVLFGKLRPYFHKVGVAPINGACSTDIVVIASKSTEWSAFVLACVSSVEFVSYTNQGSTGTKMPRTNWKTMGDYRICLPTAPILGAFQNAMRPVLEQIIANVHESRTLATLRDTLLPKLVSGELRVKEGMIAP